MDAEYNDIQQWHFKDLVKVFGAKDGSYRTYQIKSKEEVSKLFADEEFVAAYCRVSPETAERPGFAALISAHVCHRAVHCVFPDLRSTYAERSCCHIFFYVQSSHPHD